LEVVDLAAPVVTEITTMEAPGKRMCWGSETVPLTTA
jgi:hypothetical protein